MPWLTATPDKPERWAGAEVSSAKTPGSVAPIAITRTPTRRRIRTSGSRASWSKTGHYCNWCSALPIPDPDSIILAARNQRSDFLPEWQKSMASDPDEIEQTVSRNASLRIDIHAGNALISQCRVSLAARREDAAGEVMQRRPSARGCSPGREAARQMSFQDS